MLESAHPSLSARLGTGGRIFTGFISGFNGAMLSVVVDVLVDNVVPVMTS